MARYEYFFERIEELKKGGLLTDAVKIYLAGLMVGERNLNRDEYHRLTDIMGFDWDTYGAVQEAALFGDIEDYKGQRVDFEKEELLRKDKPEGSPKGAVPFRK